MTAVRAIRYYPSGVGWETRYWGRYIGSVRRRGSRWLAVLPDGWQFPELYGTRRTAGERLRRSHEGHKTA